MDKPLLQQLRKSQDTELCLCNALDSASIGYWSWVRGEPMKWDGHMLRLFGVSREEIPDSFEDFLSLVADDSQEAVIEAFEAAETENAGIDLGIIAEKTALPLRLNGRPYLLPGASSQALSGLCRESTAAPTPPETNMELANFASVASHDLREPLRMVSSYLRLLEERSPHSLDERTRRYIEYACEGADRMRRLIEDLLSYARLDSHAGPPAPIALAEVLQETIDILSTTIRETRANVTVACDKAPLVLGDRTSLVRLFQNLIGNAIKFHAEGETPQVQVGIEDGGESTHPGCCIISVKDHGIGIAAEHHELLFGLFQRLNTRDEFEGSGIGLAASRKIVERIGGSISFESERGRGSTFRVRLRKASGPAATASL